VSIILAALVDAKPTKSKKIAVVTAAERWHSVVLFDKQPGIGGQVFLFSFACVERAV
jgi:hypothetical protein